MDLFSRCLAGWMISGLCGFLMRCPGLVLGKDSRTQVRTQVKGGSTVEETIRARERERREEILLNNADNPPHQKPTHLDFSLCRCRWRSAPKQILSFFFVQLSRVLSWSIHHLCCQGVYCNFHNIPYVYYYSCIE